MEKTTISEKIEDFKKELAMDPDMKGYAFVRVTQISGRCWELIYCRKYTIAWRVFNDIKTAYLYP